jgi:hypothetical protein
MKRHSIQPYPIVTLDPDFSKEWIGTAGDSARLHQFDVRLIYLPTN